MDKVSIVLTSLMTLALVVVMAPNILALNRGKVLRNIALWLAIVFALALIYQNFGPGLPGVKNAARMVPAIQQDKDEQPPADADKANGDEGFTPPKE